MSYKPQTITKGTFGGPKGGAKCAWNTDHSKLQVKLGTDTFVFPKSALPVSAFPSGEYYIQLDKDKKSITTIRPNNGMYTVRVDKFVAKEGEEPAPRTITPEGKDYSYQTFGVMLKIISPKEYKDMEILLTLNYNFEGIEDEIKGQKVTVAAYNHPRSSRTPLLQDFCEATGVWDKGPIKWQTNILPILQKRVANAEKKFQVVVKDGWIVTIFSMPDVTETEEELEPELYGTGETKTEQNEFETDTPDELEVDDDELSWENE